MAKGLVEQIANDNKTMRIPETMDATDNDRIRLYLQRESNDNLVMQHVNLQNLLARIHNEMTLVEEELSERLKAKGSPFITQYGVAERTVKKNYVVDPNKVEDLHELLGPEYHEWINETVVYKLNPDKVDDLVYTLGDAVAEYMWREERYAAQKKASDFLRTGDPKDRFHKALSKCIGIVEKVGLKIKPVNESAKSGGKTQR